jgi:hypothetical protein
MPWLKKLLYMMALAGSLMVAVVSALLCPIWFLLVLWHCFTDTEKIIE